MLLIASWIGSIFDSNIQNLLDADGIRWWLTHVLSNYTTIPLAPIIFLLVVVSVVIESGWLGWLLPKNHPLMLRQLRAHTYTNLTAIIILVCFALLLFSPNSPLLNAFGGFAHSPLARGWYPLLMLFILLLANLYGYLSGQLTTTSDFTIAHTRLLRRYSFVFVTLFIVGQICGCLDYTHLFYLLNPIINKAIVYTFIALCFVGWTSMTKV